MTIYLPIAELSVNWLVIIGLGTLVGILSGLFGVGGGFLTTPLLMFYGIPPAVAVASAATQISGASVSGMIAHWRRAGVDVKMGAVLATGGLLGSVVGSQLFKFLKAAGQLDLTINLAYVLFLGSIGALMLREAMATIHRQRRGLPPKPARKRHQGLIHRVPFKMRFHRSRLYISALAPLALGFLVGMMTAVMGVGGGFLLVPAMIYLLGMPTNVVIGTSLMQIMITTAATTILHSVQTQTVDIVLAMLLLIGGVVGAQFGAAMAVKMRAEHLRAILAVIVLAVAIRLGIGLTWEPAELYGIYAQ
jgi:uncharacterized protein